MPVQEICPSQNAVYNVDVLYREYSLKLQHESDKLPYTKHENDNNKNWYDLNGNEDIFGHNH